MKLNKILLCTGLMLSASAGWADTAAPASEQSQKLITPYGENPNILHVWAYKTQEAVTGAAKNVGKMTEKGVAKVKPSVDQAWNNSKEVASSTVQQVDQGTQQVTQKVNSRLKETREVLGGQPQQSAPIVQEPLSNASQPYQQPAAVKQPAQSIAPSAVPPEPEEEITIKRL